MNQECPRRTKELEHNSENNVAQDISRNEKLNWFTRQKLKTNEAHFFHSHRNHLFSLSVNLQGSPTATPYICSDERQNHWLLSKRPRHFKHSILRASGAEASVSVLLRGGPLTPPSKAVAIKSFSLSLKAPSLLCPRFVYLNKSNNKASGVPLQPVRKDFSGSCRAAFSLRKPPQWRFHQRDDKVELKSCYMLN